MLTAKICWWSNLFHVFQDGQANLRMVLSRYMWGKHMGTLLTSHVKIPRGFVQTLKTDKAPR